MEEVVTGKAMANSDAWRAYCYRMTANRVRSVREDLSPHVDENDIFQTVMSAVLRKGEEPIHFPVAFLKKIVRRTVDAHINGRRKPVEVDFSRVASTGPGPEAEFDRREMIEFAVEYVLAQASEEERRIITLAFFSERTNAEIAQELGCECHAVNNHRYKFFNRCRVLLDKLRIGRADVLTGLAAALGLALTSAAEAGETPGPATAAPRDGRCPAEQTDPDSLPQKGTSHGAAALLSPDGQDGQTHDSADLDDAYAQRVEISLSAFVSCFLDNLPGVVACAIVILFSRRIISGVLGIGRKSQKSMPFMQAVSLVMILISSAVVAANVRDASGVEWWLAHASYAGATLVMLVCFCWPDGCRLFARLAIGVLAGCLLLTASKFILPGMSILISSVLVCGAYVSFVRAGFMFRRRKTLFGSLLFSALMGCCAVTIYTMYTLPYGVMMAIGTLYVEFRFADWMHCRGMSGAAGKRTQDFQTAEETTRQAPDTAAASTSGL